MQVASTVPLFGRDGVARPASLLTPQTASSTTRRSSRSSRRLCGRARAYESRLGWVVQTMGKRKRV